MKLSAAGVCRMGFNIPCFLVACMYVEWPCGSSVIFGVVRSCRRFESSYVI